MNDNKSTELSQPTAPGMHYTACCTLADCTHETCNEVQKIKNAKRGGIYLDLFSGIGGFAKGFDMAGFTFDKHYFSEIDKNAIANYKYNFKNAEYAGDIRTISTGTITDKPNLITFGFPCQDLSVAGKGKGLSGARSGLFYEAVRLIEEFKPDVFIFENVKGLLSSNKGKTLSSYCEQLPTLGYMSANGNCLIQPGFCPKIESEFTLSDILQAEVSQEYFLSPKQLQGLMKGNQTPQLLEQLQPEDIQADTTQE
jgi:DNA (cytosine-5)-methyltransferase 1